MPCISSTTIKTSLARWGLTVGLVIGSSSLLATEDVEQKKLNAEVKRLFKQLSTANTNRVEEIGTRFLELEGEGVPISRMLCEAFAGAQGKTASNVLTVLEQVSPPTVAVVKQLSWPSPAAVPTHAALFEHYDTVFRNLDSEKDVNSAVAPLARSTLIQLAVVGNRANSSKTSTPNDAEYKTRRDVYKVGVKVLAKLAESSDDGAFSDLLSLVAFDLTDLVRDEAMIQDESLLYIGRAARKNPQRIAATKAALDKVVKMNAALQRKPNTTVFGALGGNIRAINIQDRVKNALREMEK